MFDFFSRQASVIKQTAKFSTVVEILFTCIIVLILAHPTQVGAKIQTSNTVCINNGFAYWGTKGIIPSPQINEKLIEDFSKFLASDDKFPSFVSINGPNMTNNEPRNSRECWVCKETNESIKHKRVLFIEVLAALLLCVVVRWIYYR